MKVWIKRLVLALVALAVAGGFFLALREQPALVDIASVETAPMQVTIDQEGMTRVRDIYTVSSPISGHLARTALEVGDPVEAGKTVVAAIHPLDPPLIDRRTEAELKAAADAARSAVELAKAEVLKMETELQLARSELERAKQLSASSTISQRAFERAVADVAVQEAQLQSARSTVTLREAELASALARMQQPTQMPATADGTCCFELTAPVDGTVLAIMTKSEQAVTPGTQIARIGDPGELELVADFLSGDAVRIAPGQKAEIIDWGGEGTIPATVRRIEPSAFTKTSALGIDEQRVNVVLDLDEPAPQLGDGFRVFVRIAIWQQDGVLQIPISALFRADDDWATFRVADATARQVALEIGQMNDDMAEVRSGLTDGDSVIVHPSDTLSDGSAVEPRLKNP